MDAGHWALLILAVLLLALAVTMLALYVVQTGRTSKAKDLYNEACDRLGAATREVESLKVQLEAAKRAAAVAAKPAEELVNDATTAHPPDGPLAGPATPDPG